MKGWWCPGLLGLLLLSCSRETAGPEPETGRAGLSAERKVQIRRFWEAYNRATTRRIAEDWSGAAAAYQEALVLDPEHEDARYYLGNACFELGRYAEAEQAWRQLAEANPLQSSRSRVQLAMLYSSGLAGAPFDLEVAERELHQALAINQEESGPILRLGEIALLRGDRQEALRHLRAARQLNYNSVSAHYLMGYLEWAEGKPQTALEELQQAVRFTRAAAPAPQASAEGDTRKKGPLLARGVARRGLLAPHWGRLAEWPEGPVTPARMEEEYARLDRVMKEMQQQIRDGRLGQ